MSRGILCSKAALGSTTVAHCYGGRVTPAVWFAWRKKHTAQVHAQGHNDKGRRLVHCAQRTMLATTDSLFAEWLQVSLVENVHLTKHTSTKYHPVSIHFVRKRSGKDERKMPATSHHFVKEEGAIMFLSLGL